MLLRAADEVLDHRSGPRALGDLRLPRGHRRSRRAAPPRAEAVQIDTAPAMPRVRGSISFAIRFPRASLTTTTRCRGPAGRSIKPHRRRRIAGLLAEALRALRPEAAIYLHGLAGDRPVASLALPGPAAAVQHVPA